jgi:hypothetical protein
MSARLLLDTFQQDLEMSVGFGFLICRASAKSGSVGNLNVLQEYIFIVIFFFLFGGGDSNNKAGLQVIVENMKYVLISM